MSFLIDSGAAVSVVSYDAIPLSMAVTNAAPPTVGANGDPLDVIGCMELDVFLDTLSVRHSFIVVRKLTVECILSIDFLSRYGAVIDCANNKVSFDSRVHAVADPTPQICDAVTHAVVVTETTRIPSHSSCIINAAVQNNNMLSGRVGILEPYGSIQSSLFDCQESKYC